MPRHINLRQIEAFKALIESGTVSRGAELLNISQPAMSKLIAHLEMDTGLKLFDRVKKRLAPTEHAIRLHNEVDRIFAGVRQVESAIDALRREEQGRLTIGVLPALAGSFIQRATIAFLDQHPNVFCSIKTYSSHMVVERLVVRQLDIGLTNGRIDNPYVSFEPLMEDPLVCIMPLDHPLTDKRRIEPSDLDQLPFIGFDPDIYISQLITKAFEAYKVEPRIILSATSAQPVCEFVAAGLGVSLVHPMMLDGIEHRVAVRPFDPDIMFHFQLARMADGRNARYADALVDEIRRTAAAISKNIVPQG